MREHLEISKNAAKEGMVLLKNNNKLLPFKKGTRLALFGKGTFDYVKGGGGSGDVTVDYIINLYEGLQKLDYVSLEENLLNYYKEYVENQYRKGRNPGMMAEPELPDNLCEKARAYTDTAIITISRFSGEEWDRSIVDDENITDHQRNIARKSKELFEKSDFYLSIAENAMIEKVKNIFRRFV